MRLKSASTRIGKERAFHTKRFERYLAEDIEIFAIRHPRLFNEKR